MTSSQFNRRLLHDLLMTNSWLVHVLPSSAQHQLKLRLSCAEFALYLLSPPTQESELLEARGA